MNNANVMVLASLACGKMLISNEGTKNGLIRANILMFEYRE